MKNKSIVAYTMAVFALLGQQAGLCLAAEDEARTKELIVVVPHSKAITYSWENGRNWNDYDMQSKINFLYGIEQGALLLTRELANAEPKQIDSEKILQKVESLTISGFKFSDLVKQIDLFYGDSANVRIPIVDAYMHALKKLRGGTTGQLEDELAALRKKYNN